MAARRAGSARRTASAATNSVALRLLQNASTWWPAPTSDANSDAVSPWAEALVPEVASTSGGFHRAKSRSPRGEPSSVTATTGRPHNASARVAGSPMVADPNRNTGSAP